MAADLATSENQSDALAGIDIDQKDSDQVKDILFDLTRRETHNFGIAFAQALVRNLGTATRMFKVPHQQAGFKVLEAPDVPSALLELGYLTNTEDEKQLNSPEWQAKVADAMVGSIDQYFARAPIAASTKP
jgi:N-acetylmuramoyl-L-alanine amidase